jgi:hypothetical protein
MDNSTPPEPEISSRSTPAPTPAAAPDRPRAPVPTYVPPEEPSFLASNYKWLSVVAVVFVIVAGWAYYHFALAFQLPQDRKLTDLEGHEINARLVACNGEVLQYIAPDDGSTRYVAISTLSAADQEFAQHLNQTLRFSYPFECALGLDGAKPQLVRVEGHNADWVKYTLLADHSTHYAPLTTFSTSDQVVIQELAASISVEPPINYTVKNARGQILGRAILGHSDAVVKLGQSDDTERYVPMSELSALDQKLVRLSGINFYLRMPLECVMRDSAGKPLSLRVEGRSASTIKYTLLTDGLTYYVPLTNFSDLDQKVLRTLPSDMTFEFPFEYTLTGTDGKPMRVRLEGRSPNIVKYTQMADGRGNYQLITSFSDADQKFLQLLPANLRLEFPLDYTLISKTGQALDAHLMGRSNKQVKFTLADNKVYNYQIDNLSDESAAFLQLLPANLVEADMVAEAPPPQVSVAALPSATDDLPRLHNQLEALVRDDLAKQAQVDASPVNSTTLGSRGRTGGSVSNYTTNRDQLFMELDSNRNQVASICRQINDILVKSPKTAVSPTVQSRWEQVMILVRHSDDQQLSLATAGPNVRDPMLKQLRDNGKQIDTLLSKIYSEIGTYGP